MSERVSNRGFNIPTHWQERVKTHHMTRVEDLDISHVARRRPGSRRPAIDDPVLDRRVLCRVVKSGGLVSGLLRYLCPKVAKASIEKGY